MKWLPRGPDRSVRSQLAIVLTLALIASLTVIVPALAAHPEASLPGSDFEIDVDANLKVDDPSPPSLDWANVAEIRATDAVNGTGDDSYAGGVKENTVCPAETTDSIPPNKSDLLSFHVYEEAGSGGHPGFLNLAWSRVSEPQGTTLMDFEFNQSSTPCSSGPNVERTPGDLLIEYAIDQGGANADITVREWTGTAWGTEAELDVPSETCGGNPCAAGTINLSPIPAADSDGLIANGEKEARTFGEAQIDLRLLFDEGSCASFGSAMLKSRSSDAFNSQLKDFVAPVPIDLQNCGNVIIRKETIPDEDPNTTSFGFTKAFDTDPATGDTFLLTDDEVKNFNDDVLFGTGYTVDETSAGPGYEFDHVDCSASTGVSPTISDGGEGSLVTFDIDADTDVLDCTYYNRALADLTFVKDAERSGVNFSYTTTKLTPPTFTLADGESEVYNDLAPDTYGATETVPPGWTLASQDCDNGDTADAVTLSAGDDVTCTFVNVIQRGAIEIVKTAKHAAGDPDLSGVEFTITNTTNGTNEVVQTNAAGEACVDGLPVSVLDGDYTVTETLPSGYESDDLVEVVTVTESKCVDGDGVVASFENIPLTDVTINVDSQIDGGTSTLVECWDGTDTSGDADYAVTTDPLAPDNGDGDLSIPNLEPTDPAVTLTCEITVDP